MKQNFRKAAIVMMISILALSGTFGVFGQSSNENPTSYYSNWAMVIDGAVNNPLTLSINDLAIMPKIEIWGTIYCNGDPVAQGTWGGVPISDLVNQAGLHKGASNLEFKAYDGYTIKVAVADAIQKRLIIAYELDGQPLKEALRLVVPGYPGNFWISQITEMKVTSSTNYDIGPKPTMQTPKPTIAPFPTKAPTPTPTQRPSPTPEFTEIPTLSPTPAQISQISPKQDTPQIVSQQNHQQQTTITSFVSNYSLLILVVSVSVSIAVSLLFLKRRANTHTSEPVEPSNLE